MTLPIIDVDLPDEHDTGEIVERLKAMGVLNP
jgi:hypothetical protein